MVDKVKKVNKWAFNPYIAAGGDPLLGKAFEPFFDAGDKVTDILVDKPVVPEIDEPEPMAESDEAALKRNRRRRAAMSQTGRASTFLSKDKLG